MNGYQIIDLHDIMCEFDDNIETNEIINDDKPLILSNFNFNHGETPIKHHCDYVMMNKMTVHAPEMLGGTYTEYHGVVRGLGGNFDITAWVDNGYLKFIIDEQKS